MLTHDKLVLMSSRVNAIKKCLEDLDMGIDEYSLRVIAETFAENEKFYITVYMDKEYEGTAMNRLNSLWIVPTLLLVAPFRYVVTGEFTQYKKNTLFGRMLKKLIGDY